MSADDKSKQTLSTREFVSSGLGLHLSVSAHLSLMNFDKDIKADYKLTFAKMSMGFILERALWINLGNFLGYFDNLDSLRGTRFKDLLASNGDLIEEYLPPLPQ